MINEIVSLDKQAGTDLSGVDDIGNVLERGGLDFNVEKVPMFTPEGNKVNNKYLIRRTDSNFVLGTCGKRYTTVDNSTMFAPFDSVVSRCGATYENAGAVGHGKTCWVSAKMPKEFHVETPNGRDEYNQRVIMLVYHDGLRRNVYFTFNNRVICNNMLGSLQNRSRGSRGHGVRHTPTWEANLGQAEEAFQASIESANTFIVNANKLAKLPMRKKEAEQFAKEFVRDFKVDKKKETDRSDRSKTILDNRVDNVMTLFSEGMGNSGRTRYDMLNAVTEYLDHHTGRKDVKWAPSKFLSNLQGNQGSTKRRVVAELLKVA
jgi:phage/plasmid-like protein (TIGR03299 family)